MEREILYSIYIGKIHSKISAAPIFSKIGKIIAKDLKVQLTLSVRTAIGENAKFMK